MIVSFFRYKRDEQSGCALEVTMLRRANGYDMGVRK